jgi:antitoxin component YwqK of YwqJK toxin-antitoxin module
MNRCLNPASALLCCLLGAGSCTELQPIEIKGDDGRVLEKYAVDKTSKQKHGIYSRFSAHGNLTETAEYKNDLMNGKRTLFYPSGKVEEFYFYKAGKEHGAYKGFHENGKVKKEGQYVNGVMEGEWKFYYPSGSLKTVCIFKDNLENGLFKEYTETGILTAEGTYLDEKEHGLLKIYDEVTGQLKRQMHCDNGTCRTTWVSKDYRDTSKNL